jgi:hypothetical protein
MRPVLRLLAACGLLCAASPALAVETSFHTYDGFAETVDAFRLVSMIFTDPRYETLVLIMASVGIALGALLASVRGSGLGLVAFGFQILVGVGLFVGMVATTGTVHVYDRVRNAYQPVGDVPVLLVLVAGATNMIERALAETIDDNTLDPHAKLEFGAGGHSFDLFLNAVSPRGPMTDTFLDATIKDYARQCYPVARVSAAYPIDDDMLFRTTTDLPAAFAAMAGPATFSTVYTETDKGGTTVSCTDAWTHISGRLGDPALFDDYTRRICARTGFDTGSAQQLARCRSQLGDMGQMMLGRPLTTQALMSHILLGNTVGDVLFEDSPATAARVMANRAVVSNGLATLSVANAWMPAIRATVFGIMLFMIPVALLFILTPINLRVASFALGLFVFVAMWGVIDAGIYQLTLGRAVDALEEMRGQALGANAWLLAPSAARKRSSAASGRRRPGLPAHSCSPCSASAATCSPPSRAARSASPARAVPRRRRWRPARAMRRRSSPRHRRSAPGRAPQLRPASAISANARPSAPAGRSAKPAGSSASDPAPPAALRLRLAASKARASSEASRRRWAGATSPIRGWRARYRRTRPLRRSINSPRRTRCANSAPPISARARRARSPSPPSRKIWCSGARLATTVPMA